MSTTAALQDRIRALLVRALNIQVPSDDMDLIESGVIDSLALVELLFALEQEFSVSIPFDTLDLESFRSIRTIAELVATVGDGVAK